MIGTALEWYDFMIYNMMAALIFNRLFFPEAEPLTGTLLAFSTYAVGYISRPLGGLLFGRLGDRIGRRAVLVSTLIVMGLTTASIAILPTYDSIGALAPAILVLLRLLQGVALGGEWAGAVLLAVEHGRPERSGLNASWAQTGPAMGTLLSAAVIGATTFALPEDSFIAWGWRIPFAISMVLVLIGLWIRRAIDETPFFRELQERRATAEMPVREILRDHKRSLLVAGGARIGPDVVYSLLVVFSVTYITQTLALPRGLALTALFSGAAANALATPLLGALTDRIGRRPVYAAGVVASVPLALFFFHIVGTKDAASIIAIVTAGMLCHAAMYAAQGAFIVEQFTPKLRYTGASIAYTFGSLAAGAAFAPLIMGTILKLTAGTGGISVYIVTALGVTALCLRLARPLANKPENN